MRTNNLMVTALVLYSLLLFGCGGGGTDAVAPPNQLPTLTLGANFSVDEQTPVSIVSTASDSDGQISNYAWRQTTGPEVITTGTGTLSFTTPTVTEVTELEFTLTVSDNEGGTASASIQVSVLPVNLAPTIQLPAEINVDEQSPVFINATVTDSDGYITTLVWTLSAGPNIMLSGTDTASVSFTAPAANSDLSIELLFTASDNEGATNSAPVTVNVQHVNRAPQILSLDLTVDSNGFIPVTIAHRDFENDPLTIDMEFSTDGGNSWQFATSNGMASTGVTASESGVTDLLWDSLTDLGFRNPASVMLRATSNDGRLYSNTLSVTSSIDNLQVALDRVDHHAIYYGPLDSSKITTLQDYQLVVLHPSSGNLERSQVAAIQSGADPANPGDDVLVLCYISVGEDLRTVGVDMSTTNDERFIGDGSPSRGPRVDPRTNPYAGNQPLDIIIDQQGVLSPGATGLGYKSFYLDDNSVANGNPDGIPDINAFFMGAFVNIGDPAWYAVLDDMTLAVDSAAGIAEILTQTNGRGLGCDGLFLDTIDTAAPNSFTDQSSPNQSEFEWTAAGFADFTGRVKQAYPRALLLQNRGLFYYDPRFSHYAVNARTDIDLLLFESYRLNSSRDETFNASFYPDNKFNYAPKLMAEANRPDGFRVLSLGYAEGPSEQISSDTLLGNSDLGLSLLQDDISESLQVGFRHYLTNGAIDLLNRFVLDYVDLNDDQPPQWSSSYNDSGTFPPGPPTPRVGLQKLDALGNSLILSWDVALDQNKVLYIAYYQTQPFDFGAAEPLAGATRVNLTTQLGDGYTSGVGPGIYPYQDRLESLNNGETYYVLVRAKDTSRAANEDDNQVVLSARID